METIFFCSVDVLVQGYPPESFSFVEFFTVDCTILLMHCKAT